MARLYEFQSKALLRGGGVPVPEGAVASSPAEARAIAEKLGRPVVLKIQVWVTGRAGLGGIQFADTPAEAEEKAARLLGMKVKNFVVDKILVEEKLAVEFEYFAGIVMDDAAKRPLLVFSSVGGTGVEDIVRKHPDKVVRRTIDVRTGLREFEARNMVLRSGISGPALLQISDLLTKLASVARVYDARSVEVNPLVRTVDGRILAADCHLVVDDYAVYRHPDLGIEIAREFDRPPTELERVAYKAEEKDYRGTFYFLQMAEKAEEGRTLIGFHGAGGGGSMMSMDAVQSRGFTVANYCDTSGNPPASKVYRAAKVILSQPGIKGYFASGSGVASQEQYNSARGLVKAFAEENLAIPAVIRLGGNFEEEAIQILGTYLQDLPGRVEAFGRDDPPEACAARLADLVAEGGGISHEVRPMKEPLIQTSAYSFATLTGRISIDHSQCLHCESKGCISACAPRILKVDEDGRPVLAISEPEAKKGKCTECLACELYCRFHEKQAVTIELPIPGLKEYRDGIAGKS
ncbi:MAG: acetate--CoA ligase family protein [Candidatus Aminicenantes bacterium]|nr:acetate--CoA ligase family protein [Candidatus Aminicenantes bacterium]